MAFVANAAYASLQMSALHYRTHILSRVWASAAIGIAIGWALQRFPRARLLAWAIASAFVFFGAWGGMERQNLYLSTWRQHQRELASILTAAPSLRPGTSMILRSGDPPHRYLATEADYLTGVWLRLLYDDPALRTLRLAPHRGSSCSAALDGLVCNRECPSNRTCPPELFPYESLMMLDYDERRGTYNIVPSLNTPRYRPEHRIIRRPLTLRQRRLLLLTPIGSASPR
jgi:hypothetical protein